MSLVRLGGACFVTSLDRSGGPQGGKRPMKKLILAMLATAAFSASGCTKGAEAATDTAKIADTIKAQEAQWQKAYADKDINVLSAQYAEDAALGDPDDPVATTDVDRRK